MASIYDWSLVAADNGSADADINFAEGQAPSTVNNSARELMARVAELRSDIGGALTAGGTANALTVTANSAFTAYEDGLVIALRIATDNSAAATLNVNAIGAKSIRKMLSTGESALVGAELQATGIYLLQYSEALNAAAGGWLLLNPTFPIDTSTLVTLTGTQTLTNKTLTSPTINTPAITGGTVTSATIASPTVTGLDASATARGLVELATDAEAQTGTDTARAITPANLQAVTGTETRKGVLELATTAEASTGTDTARAVTPAGVLAAIPVRVAALSVGAVGTPAFLRRGSGNSSPGDLVAGSSLTYASADSGDTGISPSGTWRCMGFSATGSGNSAATTLYVRES